MDQSTDTSTTAQPAAGADPTVAAGTSAAAPARGRRKGRWKRRLLALSMVPVMSLFAAELGLRFIMFSDSQAVAERFRLHRGQRPDLQPDFGHALKCMALGLILHNLEHAFTDRHFMHLAVLPDMKRQERRGRKGRKP